MELAAGLIIETFTSVDQLDITEDGERHPESERHTSTTSKVSDHLEAMFQKACQDGVLKKQASRLVQLLSRCQAVFSQNNQAVGKTDLVQHSIPVQEGTWPIRQYLHRLGPQKEQEAERQTQDLLARGMVEPAIGAWSSLVVLVRKKDQSWHFCVYYRKQNAVTLQDAYLPRVDKSLDAFAGSRYFSTLDLTSGY